MEECFGAIPRDKIADVTLFGLGMVGSNPIGRFHFRAQRA